MINVDDELKKQNTVSGVLKVLIQYESKDVLKNTSAVLGTLEDQFPGKEKSKELRLIKNALECGIGKEYIQIMETSDVQQQNMLHGRIREKLLDEAGLSEENADKVMQILSEAVGVPYFKGRPVEQKVILKKDNKTNNTAPSKDKENLLRAKADASKVPIPGWLRFAQIVQIIILIVDSYSILKNCSEEFVVNPYAVVGVTALFHLVIILLMESAGMNGFRSYIKHYIIIETVILIAAFAISYTSWAMLSFMILLFGIFISGGLFFLFMEGDN